MHVAKPWNTNVIRACFLVIWQKFHATIGLFQLYEVTCHACLIMHKKNYSLPTNYGKDDLSLKYESIYLAKASKVRPLHSNIINLNCKSSHTLTNLTKWRRGWQFGGFGGCTFLDLHVTTKWHALLHNTLSKWKKIAKFHDYRDPYSTLEALKCRYLELVWSTVVGVNGIALYIEALFEQSMVLSDPKPHQKRVHNDNECGIWMES